MRQLFAVALVVAVVAAPACAQHGGGTRGGGFHGGFSGHAGFASSGGFSHAGGYGGGYRSGYVSGGRVYAPQSGRQERPLNVEPGVSSARPAFYHNGWERRRDGREDRASYGYAGPLGYAYYAPDYGWLDANDPGYGDDYGYGYGDGSYGDGSGVAAESYGEQAPENYVEQPDEYAQGAQYQQPQNQQRQNQEPQYQEPPPEVEPPYTERGQAEAARTAEAASLFDSDAVTLVFKDGRTPEKIHNYALTRTTLYVADRPPREIPVASLDLAATEKANREAGVSFRLPMAQ